MAQNEKDFVLGRQADWKRLANLVGRSRVTTSTLGDAELLELVQLSRTAAADLAKMQAEEGSLSTRAELSSLLQQANEVIYKRRNPSFVEGLRSGLITAAQVTRRRAAYIWFTFALFLVAVTFAASVAHFRPDLRPDLLGPMGNGVKEFWTSDDPTSRTIDQDTQMWGFYLGNNPRVALMSGAVSASTFGVGTLAIQFQNGFVMGALGYETAQAGTLPRLLTWIYPHGASELTGVFVSGAAGFVMAVALINPGRRSRMQALRESSKDAMVLLVQSMVMMGVAAPFEAYFSFNPAVPNIAKLLVGTLVLSGWIAFWTLVGREPAAPKKVAA